MNEIRKVRIIFAIKQTIHTEISYRGKLYKTLALFPLIFAKPFCFYNEINSYCGAICREVRFPYLAEMVPLTRTDSKISILMRLGTGRFLH